MQIREKKGGRQKEGKGERGKEGGRGGGRWWCVRERGRGKTEEEE